MGLFGDVDASQIPDDPFKVDPGTYLCVVTQAVIREKNDGSGNGVSLNYTVAEEDSEFHNRRIQEWKNIHPSETEDGSDLTPEQKSENSRLKQRLLQLGVPESEMNENPEEWLSKLEGVECYVTVYENPSKDGTRTFTNVSRVKLVDEDE